MQSFEHEPQTGVASVSPCACGIRPAELACSTWQRHAVDFAGFCYRKPELAVPDGHAMRHLDDALDHWGFGRQHDLGENLTAGWVHFEERPVDALGAPKRAIRVPADAMRPHAGGGEGAFRGA